MKSEIQFTIILAMSEELIQVTPLTEAEIEEARQQFKIIDSNRNGLLEENELDAYFRQSKQELRCFSKLVVKIFGKDDSVSIDQFLKFYKALSADRDSNEFIGRYIFDYIDSDHSGTIEASEFQQVIDLIKFPEGTKQDTIDRCDKMDYEQFSKRFYVLLRMAWRGLIRRNTI